MTPNVPATPSSSVARGAALNLVGAAVFGLSGFVFALVLSNQLGAADAGRFWIGLAVYNIVSRIAELGTASGLVHGVARARSTSRAETIPAIVRVALGPVILAAVIGVISIVGLAFTVFADGGEPDSVLLAFAPFVLVAALYTPIVQGLRGFGSMTANVAIDRIGRGIVQPGLAIAALQLWDSVAIAALAWGVAALLLGIVASGVFSRSATRVRSDASTADVDRSEVSHEFWTFTKPRIGGQMLDVMVLWIDVLLVGALASPTAAGIYGAVSRFAIVGMFVAEALMKVVGPRTAELMAKHDLPSIAALRRESAIAHTAIVWPVYVVVIVFAPTLASIFGAEFVDGAASLRILAIGLLISSLFGPVGSILLMSGDSKATLRVGIMGFATNLVLNLVLVPIMGIEGAAVAWAATFVVRAVANRAACQRAGIEIDLPPTVRIAGALLVSVGLAALATRSVLGGDVLGTVVAGAIAAALMLGVLVLTKPLVGGAQPARAAST